MIQELKERDIRVDRVQLSWIVQEDACCIFVPAGSNEEVKMVLVPNFLCEISEGGAKYPKSGLWPEK